MSEVYILNEQVKLNIAKSRRNILEDELDEIDELIEQYDNETDIEFIYTINNYVEIVNKLLSYYDYINEIIDHLYHVSKIYRENAPSFEPSSVITVF